MADEKYRRSWSYWKAAMRREGYILTLFRNYNAIMKRKYTISSLCVKLRNAASQCGEEKWLAKLMTVEEMKRNRRNLSILSSIENEIEELAKTRISFEKRFRRVFWNDRAIELGGRHEASRRRETRLWRRSWNLAGMKWRGNGGIYVGGGGGVIWKPATSLRHENAVAASLARKWREI